MSVKRGEFLILLSDSVPLKYVGHRMAMGLYLISPASFTFLCHILYPLSLVVVLIMTKFLLPFSLMYTQPNHSSIQEEAENLSLLQKHTYPSFSGLVLVFLCGADPFYVS